ncbi:hypothetical protein B9479_000409 [Cryptococcus floricola]|uniref:Ubiquitin carboxyl-terminal hydrolase n=1 Tax=Cryptococcus floricola TaxID=2591691 RepID=A0A5D3B9R1_9TREE|nr:hypothetical protein B9479_000409 [Cryptococcus floricola]
MPKISAATMELTIKHSGKNYNVPVTQETTTATFKQAVSELTRVPVERMKVMVKGKLVKDDTDYAALASQKVTVMVIGAAEALPEAPTQPIVFLEDVGEGSYAKAEPNGLVNLGNTCYLNSTIQALKVVPEIDSALKEFTPSGTSADTRVVSSLKKLMTNLDSAHDAVAPLDLIANLRVLAPQFGETDNHGHYSQQDADEAWTTLISALRSKLPHGADGSLVDNLMGLELEKTFKCAETDAEPESTSTESLSKLQCNISGTTNFLLSGIQDSLTQQVEKNSPVLGRNATYTMKSSISKLPEYLTVHMVRFYWRRDIQKKAKIMRKVKFPLELDLLELLTPSLRARTQPLNVHAKNVLKDRDARATVLKRKPGEGKEEEEEKRKEEREKAEELLKTQETEGGRRDGSAFYELAAVVTHKGASADSGHYIGWARMDDGAFVPAEQQQWAKFDDNKVTFCDAQKILSMDGGGEDSVAYILLYRQAKI